MREEAQEARRLQLATQESRAGASEMSVLLRDLAAQSRRAEMLQETVETQNAEARFFAVEHAELRATHSAELEGLRDVALRQLRVHLARAPCREGPSPLSNPRSAKRTEHDPRPEENYVVRSSVMRGPLRSVRVKCKCW